MSVTANITKTLSAGGVSFPESRQVTADGEIVHNVDVAEGFVGSLSTRTDDNTGVVTVDDSSHTIENGDRVDLYWVGGCRRGMAAGSPSGADIPIDGGSGDNLPTEDTAVTIVVPEELDISVLGTNVAAILLYSAQHGQIVFETTAPAEALAKELGTGVSYVWHEDDGEDNPITGDLIATVYLSHDGTAEKSMRVGILYNNA